MIKFHGWSLPHPVMNGAGTCKTLADVKRFALSGAAGIMVGSISVEPRSGNRPKALVLEPTYSLNSYGLPNPGLQYYRRNLEEMVRVAHKHGKPLFVSVVGFTPEEYYSLAKLCRETGVDFVEVNLGCPNVWENGAQKRIPSFSHAIVQAILKHVERAKVAYGVKLSPFSNPEELEEMARTLNAHQTVFVTTSNTFPNALSNNNPMGLGGPALKPIALGQIKQLSKWLRKDIGLVGVGGVETNQDVEEYLRAGSDLVQVVTAYYRAGSIGIYQKIANRRSR